MLKILGRVTSINVRKVLWVADELGLAYDREDWGMPIRSPNVPEFLELNPNGQVPVLIDDDFVIWESNAILVYLCERERDSSLWPADIEGRSRTLQWLFWQVTELNPSWRYAVNALIRKQPGMNDPAKIEASMAEWTKMMDILEAQLMKTEAYVTGSEFTIADIALGLSIHRWFMTPFEKKNFPAITAYYRRLKARDAGAAFMGEATP